ncbi:MAG: FAD-dependent oxidoreductase [Solirubrobacteraceae bacterium]
MAPRDCDVLVVGSGVIGLTTGVCLAETGLRVRIRTAALPQSTTSRAASAMWGPSFAEPRDRVLRWTEVTLDDLRELANRADTGVRTARGTLASRRTAEPPPPDVFPGLEVCPPDELPEGFVGAFRVLLPIVDMPRYLDYLLARLAEAGGEIEVRALRTLAEAAEEAPVVVNCAGIGARDLVPDPALRPVRGQHVVVENPGLDDFFMEEPLGTQWAGYFPHGDQVVLGGNADLDEWSLDPDPATAEGIVRRCVEVEPALAGARIVEHRVGLRPSRASVRLEEERIGSSRCVHNYGHGGSGVSLSWGCAREIRAMLTGTTG